MANAYSVLGQSNPSAATLTTAYIVPGATQAIISSINVCNRSSTATTFRIAVRPAGAAISNEHYLAYDAEILANEIYNFAVGITVEATDIISVYATLATLSFNVFGQEIT
jgi:hypothetical protein